MSRDLLQFLVGAVVGILVSAVLVVVFRGGLLWGVLLVMFCGCGGALIGAVLGRGR